MPGEGGSSQWSVADTVLVVEHVISARVCSGKYCTQPCILVSLSNGGAMHVNKSLREFEREIERLPT